ncbi:MAG: AsnC family transcriptional regulator [Peptococcaceae bacterium]
MDCIDKQLLTIIQKDFPVCPQPFQELGKILGISENETIERVKKLKELGIIRRLGGIFDSRKLGYRSTLCAMEVPKEKLAEVSAVVNQYLGVTHNYLRNHPYNIWFTLITPSDEHLKKVIGEIENKTGLKVFNLPALKIFKIKVNFQVPGAGGEKSIV